MQDDFVMVEDYASFKDFVGYFILSAPDNFLFIEGLSPDKQMNLEKAMDELRRGLPILKKRVKDPERYSKLEAMLNEAIDAYQTGDSDTGVVLVQEFRYEAFSK